MSLHGYRFHQSATLVRFMTTGAFQNSSATLRIKYARLVTLAIGIAHTSRVYMQLVIEFEIGMLDHLACILLVLAHTPNDIGIICIQQR